VARLGATTAYVLGSADALGEEVVEGLRATGVRDVTRLGGVDRFDTARLVAGEVRRLGGATGEAYVVEGANADPARGWPDAVAVASVAAADGVPVLLATTTSLPAATREALGPAESVTVVGGPGAVGDDVLEELRTLADRVTRISGPTRTATSVAVTDERAPGARRVWLATSGNWPDALAAGPAAAADSAALVLVDGAEVTRSPEVLELLDRRDLERVVVTGSVEVLLPNVEVAARDRLNADLLRGSPFESLVLPG
jgi:putative cell wall-binding protein